MATKTKSATSDVEKAEIQRLRSSNPKYVEMQPEWEFYLSAYQGGPDFACASNIYRHARETKEDYDDRVKRLHTLNYCQPIIDFYTNFIFNEPIERNGGTDNEWFQKFTTDVNKKGDNIDDFMRSVSDDARIYGMTYTFVEAPPPNDQVVSKLDEEMLGIRPYWVAVKPEEIISWIVDDFGQLLYIKRRQLVEELVLNEIRSIEKYTEIFSDKYEISRVDVTDSRKPKLLGKETLPNDLGEIPVVISRLKPDKTYPYLGITPMRDFAYNQRDILNLTSMLQEFLYKQAFNILAMESEMMIPGMEQTEGDVGTSNVLNYPKGANVPAYVTPPVAPAGAIREERELIKREMFLRAAQDTVSEMFNGTKSSGFSQAQSFSKTVPHIAAQAEMLERTETRLMQLTAKRLGKEWVGKIKYKDRYEITSLPDTLTQLSMLASDLGLQSPTFFKDQLKRLVNEFDGKMTPDVREQVYKEIEDMNWHKWASVQQAKLIGRGGTSAAKQQEPKGTGTMQEVAQESTKLKQGGTKKLKSE